MKSVVVRHLASAVALALLAAGCAGNGGGSGSGREELKTASDMTTAQKRAGIRMQLAVGYYQQGQYAVALDEIKQAIASDPDMADAYGVRGLIYMAMGETGLADDNFQRALKLAPANPDLSNNYGTFLCQNDRAAQAIAFFDAALKNRTYSSPERALINAGSCSIKLKQYDAAEHYLLDALRIVPDELAVNVNLARVYLERRDNVRAGFFINRVKAVAKIDTLSAEVLWLAIRVQRRLGDKADEATLAGLLRRNYPGSPEYAALQRGAFDE